MARNATGTYSLPSGNPVSSGTLITASWANTTLSDIATTLTDSLSRSGQGGMTAALRLFDGTNTVPGLAWGSETTTGFYRAGAGDTRLMITGSQVMQFLSTGVAITGTLSASGNASVGGTLSVTGAATLTANPVLSAGTANGVAYLNGSKVLTTGSALTFDGSRLSVYTGSSFAVAAVLGNASGSRLAVLNDDGGSAIRYDAEKTGGAAMSHVWLQNGTEQMRLTSTGLGIGTSSPGSRLHANAGAATTVAMLESTGISAFLGLKNSGQTAYIGADSAGALVFQTPGSGFSTKLTIDISGNLGLGVTPSAWGSDTVALQVGGSTFSAFAASARFLGLANARWDGTNFRYLGGGSAQQYRMSAGTGTHEWYVAPSGTAGSTISFTQAMTLDASGHLLVGNITITNSRLGVRGATSDDTQNALLCKNLGDFDLLQVRNDGLISTGTRANSPYNSTTASAANMFVNASGGLQRSTSSIKYKDDVQDAKHGLTELLTLRSVTYRGKTDGTKVFGGMIAEEVHDAGLTEFVEYNEDGEPDALAYGHMVALCVKAIQELKAIVDAQAARIATLEGQP